MTDPATTDNPGHDPAGHDDDGTAPKTWDAWTAQALDAVKTLARAYLDHLDRLDHSDAPMITTVRRSDVERYLTVDTIESLLRMINANPAHWSWPALRNTDPALFTRMVFALGVIEEHAGATLVPERIIRLADLQRRPAP